MKRFIRLLVTFILVLSCVALNAEAAETSGTCGDDLTWTFEESTGTMTISGTGKMWDFDYDWDSDEDGDVYWDVPWEELYDDVKILVLEEGVSSIGRYAFFEFYKMTDVVIPESMASIGIYAFYDCCSLASVRIPGSVTGIGKNAFYGCDALADLTICDGVGNIGDSAFYGCDSLTSVTIPGSVTSIGIGAFSGCWSLRDVTICKGVEKIGIHAFNNCVALSDISLPDSIISIDSYAFTDCDGLTAVTISGNGARINSTAFHNCDGLTSVIICEGVTSIGDSAFCDCDALQYIKIPGSVTSIGTNMGQDCSSLTEIAVDSTNKKYQSVNGVLFNKAMTKLITYPAGISGEYVIPEGVTAIGGYAFYNCDALTAVTIPGSMNKIGAYAFLNCSGLERVTISDGVTNIGKEAFANCVGLTEVTIPGSVTEMGEYAFERCFALTEVTFCEGAACIGERAFLDCTALTGVTIPDSMRYIRFEAFRGCGALQEIKIPGSVTDVAKWTFRDCSSLRNVTICEGVTKLRYEAFKNCTSLTSITLPGSLTEIGYAAFGNCPALTDVHYPLARKQKENIKLYSGNDNLLNATWHYPEPEELTAPTIKSAVDTATGKPKLSWKAVVNADFYRIYRATSKTGKYSYLKSTRSFSYMDTTAAAGKNYYYKVRAVAEDPEEISPYSNAVNRMCDLPVPQVSQSVNTTSGKIVVSWNTVEGAAKYRVYRSVSRSGDYELVYTTAAYRAYTDKTAEPGTNYYYKVKAIHEKESANSALSEAVNRVCDLAKPVVTIKLKSGAPRLTWEKISGAEKYYVYRATSKDGEYTHVKTTKTSSSFTDTDVKAGKTYYYKVKAIHSNSSANSAFSSVKYIKAK